MSEVSSDMVMCIKFAHIFELTSLLPVCKVGFVWYLRG